MSSFASAEELNVTLNSVVSELENLQRKLGEQERQLEKQKLKLEEQERQLGVQRLQLEEQGRKLEEQGLQCDAQVASSGEELKRQFDQKYDQLISVLAGQEVSSRDPPQASLQIQDEKELVLTSESRLTMLINAKFNHLINVLGRQGISTHQPPPLQAEATVLSKEQLEEMIRAMDEQGVLTCFKS